MPLKILVMENNAFQKWLGATYISMNDKVMNHYTDKRELNKFYCGVYKLIANNK